MPELVRWIIYPDAAEKVTDTPECAAYLVGIARQALNAAYDNAPEYTGRYKESLSAVSASTSPPSAKLQTSSWYWHFIEYGTIDIPPYHVLGEAVDSVVEVYVPLGKGE